MYTVYKHTSPGGKVYIGITKQNPPTKRWLGGQGYRTQRKFYRAILKYGWKNFSHEILFQTDSPEAAEREERRLIKLYRSTENAFGYNVEGGGNYKKEVSEETKEKLRQRMESDSFKEKMKVVNEKRWSSPEAHKAMRERFLGENNPMYGKKLTPEHRAVLLYSGMKLVESQKKPVRCIETGIVYESISEAARQTPANSSCIGLCCMGKQKKAGKLHWEYAQ